MEHHEANNNHASHPLVVPDRADQGYSRSYATVVPPSPPTQTAAFRSQRINFAAATTSLSVPPLLQPSSLNNKTPALSGKTPLSSNQDDSLPLAMAKKKEAVGTVPIMPSFHILERTAIRISEDVVSVSALLDRVLQYLRDNSISYDCEADTGCFDCMAPSMVGFAVQLWRGNNNNAKQFIVEVQRREGCAIALNSIRRSFLRHVRGEQEPSPLAGRRRPMPTDSYNNNNNNTHYNNNQYGGSNKRQRSMSTHTARLNCQDALVLTLRLLESPMKDQQKLGLESLSVLTDARLVSPLDALTASRALVLGDSPAGARLQQRMGNLLREFQPGLTSSSGVRGDSYHASLSAKLYHIALHALANALEQVVSRANSMMMTPRVDLNCPFWQTTVACLLYSLNGACRSPHEAALSAKCIRFLLPTPAAAQRFQVPTLQTSLRRTFELGQAHNVSLAEESQKTLYYFKA